MRLAIPEEGVEKGKGGLLVKELFYQSNQTHLNALQLQRVRGIITDRVKHRDQR